MCLADPIEKTVVPHFIPEVSRINNFLSTDRSANGDLGEMAETIGNPNTNSPKNIMAGEVR